MIMERYFLIPVVGAIIGYATNWIAVKMLFHPRKAIYLGSWKLPLTPGVIPKGKGRLARAIGNMVEEKLLTEDIIREKLLSDEIKGLLAGKCQEKIDEIKVSQDSVQDVLLKYVEEEKYNRIRWQAENNIADHIYHGIIDYNLGHLIVEKMYENMQDLLANPMVMMFLGEQGIQSIMGRVENSLNKYIEENGYEVIIDFIDKEMESLSEKHISESVLALEEHKLNFPEIVVKIYENIVDRYLEKALNTLNLSKLVEDKINAMDVKEVEDLVLTVMQKELGTIVNLGALIGLILGLINVAILMI